VRRATESTGLVEALGIGGSALTVRQDFSVIAQAASSGNTECVAIIEESAAHLAVAVVSTINLLDLDQIFLAGPGFADAGEIYLRVIRERIEAVAFMRTVIPIKVELSAISTEPAAIGGAALVLQEHLTPHHFSPAVIR
jgi:predicted NBD/HSP70 family sugar kinase